MKIIDFYADWCGPCKAMTPVIEKIAREHDIELVKVDIETDQEQTARYGVRSVPTIILLDSQEDEQARIVGAMPQRQVEAKFNLD